MATFLSNIRQLFGSTVLHKAAEKLDLADLSLQVQRHPSDVNSQEPKMGWTPLHVAADKGFEAGVRELLLRGCKPDIQDKEGRTALHIAAGRGCRKVVEDLLKRGASANIRDKSGRYAYDYAAQRHPVIAALLGGRFTPPPAIATAAAGAVPSAAAMVTPLPAMPAVDLISGTCVDQLLPTPPSLTHGSVISTGANGSFYPNVHHVQAPAGPLLLAPPPPPQSSSQPKGLHPAGPDDANAYGIATRAAPQPYTQLYESQGHQAIPNPPQEVPAVRIPYPVLPGTQQPLANDGCQSDRTRTAAREPYPHSPSFSAQPQHPPPPFQPRAPLRSEAPLLKSDPASISAATGGRGSGGRGSGGSGGGGSGMGPIRESVNAAAADLDWGSTTATDWGDEPELPPPPPVPGRPNFNPILSARIQLERLMGAGLSQLGIGPSRPAATAAASGDPRVNAGSAPSDPRVNVASGVSAGSIGSSIVSVCSASLRGGRTYSYEELRQATGSFSPVNKLGEGGYGPVYRGWLDGIPVAVKVMDTSEGCMQGRGEFEAEVNILSSLHHPHLVLLIGSCPEKGILVYELMPNGNLENYLFGRDGSSSGGGGGGGTAATAGPAAALPSTGPRMVSSGALSWRDRVRIAAEVASALLFLHTAPIPIVHMDLKPANILLDTHLTAKLGDVGLARLAPMLARPAGPAAAAVQAGGRSTVMDSRLVGTFEYMDPEYMQTAQYSARSDVYALGMVMLQMLTGKGGKQVISQVEAERRDPLGFGPCIDPRAGPWPLAEAAAFADLALRCVAYSRQDRPDLRSVILPALTQLKQRTHLYEEQQQQIQQQQLKQQQQQQDGVPPMFLCPITQEIMDEPVVAADGYTYEKLAITEWIKRSRTSPLTNLPLEHTNVVENRTLRSAIREWSEQHSRQQEQPRQHPQQYQPPTGEPPVAAAKAATPPPVPPQPPPLPRAATEDFGGW